MLTAIIVLLLLMWLLGFTVFNLGAIIHVLLVIAIVVFLFRIISGRRPVV